MCAQLLETRDVAWLRQHLRPDPATHAYLLGDLEEPFFSQCRWLAMEEEEKTAILLLYFGLSVPSLQAVGDGLLVEALLDTSSPELPQRFHYKLAKVDFPSLEEVAAIENYEWMWAMKLRKETLQRPSSTLQTRLLTEDDLEEVLDVYEDYPGHFFEPSQLTTNLYCGAWQESRLVGVAGTHVLNLTDGVGVLGNIVTRTESRGQGVGKTVVGALCRELFARGCEDVVLHVLQDNEAAIACYKRLGFKIHSELVQGFASALSF